MTESGPSTGTGVKSTSTSSMAAEYSGKLMSAASIAGPFQADISSTITKRTATGKKPPKLVGILATPSPPSVAYAEWTKKACEQVGIEFEIWKTWQDDVPTASKEEENGGMQGVENERPDTDLEADVEDLIIAANADDSIHGIMVYYPIFGGRQDTYLQQILDPRKDVEGLHFSYCWNMYHNVRWVLPNQLGGAPGTTSEASAGPIDKEDHIPPGFAKSILPCTPLAVVKCLEGMGVYEPGLPYGDRLYGKVITVVNRSEVVGRPLAALLSNDGAKVFSIDLGSIQEFNKRVSVEKDRQPSVAVMKARERNSQRSLRTHHTVRPCNMTMEQCIRASDVVISGVPTAKFKIETDWIKSGAVTVNFSSEKNFEKDVRRQASKHLPAIGKTTIAMLQRNLLRLVQYREMSSSGLANTSHDNGGAEQGQGPGSGNLGGDSDGQDESGGRPRPSSGPSGSSPGNAGGSHHRQIGGAGGAQDNNMAMDIDSIKRPNSVSSLFSSPSSVRFNQHGSHISIPGFASRGRACTMTLPHVERAKERLLSTASQDSPTHPYQQSRSGSISTGSNLWDWRQANRRESTASGCTIPSSACSPPFEATKGQANSSNRQSPLLFAPISPFHSNHSTVSSQGTVHTARPIPLRSNSTYAASSPRSGTPVSPLFIDGLSVEDGSVPPEVRSSWDYTAPRTPQEGTIIPSVFERPTKDMPQRHILREYYSPKGDKLAYTTSTSQPSTVSPPDNRNALLIHPTGERIAHSRRRRRPPFSYSSLIAQAISSSPEGRMTLREIYTWISNAYPDLYSMEGSEGSGWQNTVRHNLSLNKSFIKVARTAQDIYESCSSGLPNQSQAARGKGGWWTLDPNVSQAQIGSNLKGDTDMGDYGNDYNEDQISSLTTEQRAHRRRRTSSFATSIVSSEDAASPKVDQFLPSVLQHPGARTSSNEKTVNGSAIPSVFLSPRPLSVETALTQNNGADVHVNVYSGKINGRTRGYTTSDALVSIRHPSYSTSQGGSESPSHRPIHNTYGNGVPVPSSTYSPSKRKLPFNSHPSDHARLARMEEASAHHAPSARRMTVHSPAQSLYNGVINSHHQQSTVKHSIHNSIAAESEASSSRLSAIRRIDDQQGIPQRPIGRMSISDLLNT